jgi:hypothetical protein
VHPYSTTLEASSWFATFMQATEQIEVSTYTVLHFLLRSFCDGTTAFIVV